MDNRRLLLAAFLSLGVLLLWQAMFPSPRTPVQEPPAGPDAVSDAPLERLEDGRSFDSRTSQVPSSTTPQSGTVDSIVPEVPLEPIRSDRLEEVTVEGSGWVATLSNRGAQMTSLELINERGDAVQMIRPRSVEPYPFGLVGRDLKASSLNSQLYRLDRSVRDGAEELRFEYQGPEGRAVKTFVFPPETDSFGFSIETSSSLGFFLGPGVRTPRAEDLGGRFDRRYASSLRAGDLVDWTPRKVEEPFELSGAGTEWVAVEDHYFIAAVLPETTLESFAVFPVVHEAAADGELLDFASLQAETEGPRDVALALFPRDGAFRGDAYFGPKQFDRLGAFDAGLQKTVRFGFTGIIARPLLAGLRWIHGNLVSNWGWSIVLLTFVVRLILFPLTHKSHVSMQKLQKLNPRMEAIRSRYKPKLKDKQGRPNLDQQRKMNAEIQELFREEGVNPAGGCLPILLQLPVFFGFFRVLSEAVELWEAPWAGWIQDLAAPDPLYVLPILMGATQFGVQKMTPAIPNPTQRFIMMTMPIWFTVLSFGFPSGLVLYWLTSNLLSVVQQGAFNRMKGLSFFGKEIKASAS